MTEDNVFKCKYLFCKVEGRRDFIREHLKKDHNIKKDIGNYYEKKPEPFMKRLMQEIKEKFGRKK